MTNTDTEPTMPTKQTLTLILAATTRPPLGIGNANTLPWPSLKPEMAYFARVTKRIPNQTTDGKARMNAVIMGRRTWDSIPPKFRPLKGRVNVIVSTTLAPKDAAEGEEGPLVAPSLSAALALLQARDVPRVFVIGGAKLYEAALGHASATRVLLTKLDRVDGGAYECDTFFPLDLDSSGARGKGWVRRGEDGWREWTGELGKEHVKEEGGVRMEFCLYERETKGG